MVAVATVAWAQPKAEEIDLDDIVPVIKGMMAPGEKNEFETTAQYQGRLKATIDSEKKFFFALPGGLAYNADTQMMWAFPQFKRMSFYHREPLPDLLSVLGAEVKTVTRGEQRASGLYRYVDEFGIIISDEAVDLVPDVMLSRSLSDKSPGYSFPMTIEEAKELKPWLRIVMAGSIKDPGLGQWTEPRAGYMTQKSVHYAQFDLKEILVADLRNGAVLARFPGRTPVPVEPVVETGKKKRKR